MFSQQLVEKQPLSMKRFAVLFSIKLSIGLLGLLVIASSLVRSNAAKPSKKQKPNYLVVFPQNKVNSLTIRMTKADWDSIKADMKSKFRIGFGEGFSMGPMGGQRRPNDRNNPMPQGGAPPMGMRPGGPPPFGDGVPAFGSGEPDYVQVSVDFKGKKWKQVGFRLKGNSSLSQSWGQGVYKLPFRLKFDKFTSDKKASFYGFEELSMSPSFGDQSLIREKVAADVFRMAGVPAAQTAFYQVYIDFGEGVKYCGVYTMVEVIEDTMVKTQFGDKNGNIYKPESSLKKFSEKQFEKKNNKKKADYSDIEAFVTALNSPVRTTNPAQWRTELEQVFNVNHFLKWLAVNTTIASWDSYGVLPHNYYLYNDPSQHLTWIPWDENDAFGNNPMRNMPPPNFAQLPDGSKPSEGFKPPSGGMGLMGRGLSLSLKEASNNAPLIRYLADDTVYFAQYKALVKTFSETIFTPTRMNQLFKKNHQLIAPFVVGPIATEQKPYSHLRELTGFQEELLFLQKHIEERKKAVQEFLSAN